MKTSEMMARDYTPDGRNVSPPIAWRDLPAGTRELALIMDDPDAQFGGGNFVHWVVYRIPATAKGLPAELPMDATLTAPADIAGTIQGLSGFRRAGYRGPAPPAGKPHHYTFTVYALDAELPLAEGLNKADLLKAMEGHIIGQGSLVSIYERVKP
jgi:Raf kinase inhibitor-like YbhB/YbcL family protein